MSDDKLFVRSAPFVTATKYVVLINTNINGAHPACLGSGVPPSRGTKCQFKTQFPLESCYL